MGGWVIAPLQPIEQLSQWELKKIKLTLEGLYLYLTELCSCPCPVEFCQRLVLG